MSELFRLHPRSWQNNRFVYPVVSRRSKGLSIGINLNPDRICNFDCIYCSVDRTGPAPAGGVDLSVVRSELNEMLAAAVDGSIFAAAPFDRTPAKLRRLNDIAFSGDGEPTSCSQFFPACQLAAEMLDRHNATNAKIVVITNATLLHRPNVVEALAFLDHHNGEIWAKLDAGTEAYYTQIERTNVPLERVLGNILAAGVLRPIIIQSLFMNVSGQPPTNAEIDAYVDRLRALKNAACQIKLVQVYTVARTTAEASVTPLENSQIDQIAERVGAIGLDAEAFYGPA